jgi:dTDP-4-dehydrorhamnose reductase
VLREAGAEVVVNCVGLADVDRAEREPALADALNRGVVQHLVTAQEELGFRLVHISTDYVFDGRTGGYREVDPVGPVNEYGRSKLNGETLLAGRKRTLVLRISSPFGPGAGARKTQFFRYVSDALRAGQPVQALTDQRVTATYLPDLGRAIERLLKESVEGLVHIASQDPRTRFEFAREVARTIDADPALVRPAVRSQMVQWVAVRPADTSLDVGRSLDAGVRYTPIGEALSTLLGGSAPA